MVSNEVRIGIHKKFSGNKEIEALVLARDVKGLVEKFKEAGFDVTEGDVTEYLFSMRKLSEDELEAVSGGCIFGCPVDKCYD